MASAGAAVLRPQPITRSGQGGRNGRPPSLTAASGANHNCGGRYAHGARTERHFSIKPKPVASARPSDWLAIPALPSCSTQTSGAALPSGEGCAGVVLTGMATIGCGLREALPGGKRAAASRNKIARGGTASYGYRGSEEVPCGA